MFCLSNQLRHHEAPDVRAESQSGCWIVSTEVSGKAASQVADADGADEFRPARQQSTSVNESE